MKLEAFTKWVMALFVIFLIFGLTSCKTKQKTIEREKEKTVSVLEEKTIDKTINDIKLDSFAKKGSSLIKMSENQSLELNQADPDKKMTVEDEKGNKLHITGANAVLKNNNETSVTNDSSEVGFLKTDKSKLDKTTESNSNTSVKKMSRSAYSYVKTVPVWLCILFVFLGLVVIFRKRLFLF